MSRRHKTYTAVGVTILALIWTAQWAAFAPDTDTQLSGEWVEIIQSADRKECRWEHHEGEAVISVGAWHPCTDKELGA